MSNRPKILVLSAVVWMTVISIPTSAEAGPLLDWLFRRNRPPATTAYYGAQPAGCCGNAYCEQTVVRYVPQVAYRTVWQPVPVTTYRRTTHCNPQTGLPMTCTRPCTTYTYQARRVPYTTYRPVYSKVAVTSPSTVGYQPAGCNSCSVGGYAGYSTPAPYYAGEPSYSSDPAGATPWESVREGGEATQENYESDPSDPGNRPPRIHRNSMNRRHRLSRVASTSPRSSRPDPFFQGPAPARQVTVKTKPESAERAETGYRGSVRTNEDRIQYESGSGRHATINRNEAARELNRRLDLQPIPNIESPLNKRLPELMDVPNNREATLIRPIPTRWASKKIDWDHVALASHVVQAERREVSSRQSIRGPKQKRIRRLDDHRFDVPRSERKMDRGWSKLD